MTYYKKLVESGLFGREKTSPPPNKVPDFPWSLKISTIKDI